jgi:deazaflavin-dependent oxidoreductase (nitroreductase family)
MDFDSLTRLAPEQYCYLTTRGRRSGEPHTVELWFAISPETRTLYILSGGRARSDWVKNLLANPKVTVRVRQTTLSGTGRAVEDGDEELQARELVVRKYYRRAYNPRGGWEADSLPVAVDLGEVNVA